MPRRRRRKEITEAQRREYRRQAKNYKSKQRYSLKQRKLFFEEYQKICKKYGCCVYSFYGIFIRKQERGDTLRTIKSHLEGLEQRIK